MNPQEYAEQRSRYRADGDLQQPLYDELARVVQSLVRNGRLPALFSPSGSWDHAAEEDVLQGWLEKRLHGKGQLRNLLDRAPTLAAFRRLAERNLRQYLSGERERSESQNLYHRVAALLREDTETFRRFREARRAQDEWWGLAQWESPGEFSGDTRTLLSAAWALGDFVVVRYRAEAKKLSPVLAADELKRFVQGLLEALERLLTLGFMMEALRERFGLDQPEPLALETDWAAAPERTDAPILLEEGALALIYELTARQAAVLLATVQDEETGEQMAARLECSPATVINEQRQIGRIAARFATTDEERAELLQKAADLLYQGGDPQ